MTWVQRAATETIHRCTQPDHDGSVGDLWRCDSCGKLWEALGYGDTQARAWRRAGWWTRRRHRTDHNGASLTQADAEELKRRFLEAQETKPERWGVITEPRDTGDRWGIWPLLILMAVFAAGFALGTWVQ